MAITVNINGIGSITFPTGVSSATVLDGVLTINLTGGGSASFNGVNHQAGTSYNFVSGDNLTLVTFNNAGAVTANLPNANTLANTWAVFVQNLGAGTVTLTPATSTIDGAATLPLTQNQGVVIFGDGTNYYTERGVGSGGGGSVTSVALSMPAEFSVSGSPVTTSGTLSVSKANQNANQVYAGPSSGGAAAPGFRALVPADYPVFVASGASHAAGAVPDPGASAGTTRFLREDATFAVPAGGGGGFSSLSGFKRFSYTAADGVNQIGTATTFLGEVASLAVSTSTSTSSHTGTENFTWTGFAPQNFGDQAGLCGKNNIWNNTRHIDAACSVALGRTTLIDFWFVMADAVGSNYGTQGFGPGGSVIGSVVNYYGFRFSTSQGDTHFQCITNNKGTNTHTIVDSGTTPDTSPHIFRMTYDGTTATFYIDGTQKAAITTTLPASGYMGWQLSAGEPSTFVSNIIKVGFISFMCDF